MRYIHIILGIILIIIIVIAVFLSFVWLGFRKPWNDIRVSTIENARDLQFRQDSELMFTNKLSEAIQKKNSVICNDLPERVNSYFRGSGEINYIAVNTMGSLFPQRTSATPRSQCKLAYAVTLLDPDVCNYAGNDTQDARCLVEVAQEMRFRNDVTPRIYEICAMIPRKNKDEVRECSSTLNNQSRKPYIISGLIWSI